MRKEAYSVRLALFEGPLDLLLHLIEKAEVDIKDIFVSEITSQYLDAVAEMDELEMDNVSEFLAMAATLLYIKSRSLLPRKKNEEPEEEEEDPEVALLRKLREYKACKEATEKLYELEQCAYGSFTKPPEEFPLPPLVVEALGGNAIELYEAFAALLKARKRTLKPDIHEVKKDTFTLYQCACKLRDVLRKRKAVRFTDLFGEDTTREECVVTFMALLELISLGEVAVEQQSTFGEIWIKRRALAGVN